MLNIYLMAKQLHGFLFDQIFVQKCVCMIIKVKGDYFPPLVHSEVGGLLPPAFVFIEL